MGNPKDLCLTVRRWCNRLLTPTRMPNGWSDPFAANASITSSSGMSAGCAASWTPTSNTTTTFHTAPPRYVRERL